MTFDAALHAQRRRPFERMEAELVRLQLETSDEQWDGPRNLLDAARVAAAGESAGRGTMVVFHGKVFSGSTAVKTHATDPDAFSAPHAAPVGRVEHGCVV